MMKLVDYYLIRLFFRYLLLVLSVLMAIYLLVDFFERVDAFHAAGLGSGMAMLYLLLKSPAIFEQMAPVAIMLAGIISIGMLNRNQELMALQSAGISVKRITSPIIFAALGFSCLTLLLGQWLLPATLSESNRIWYQEVHKQPPGGIERHGRFYHRGSEGIYSFVRDDNNPDILLDFSYLKRKEDFRLSKIVSAAEARWQDGYWLLSDASVQTMPDVQTMATEQDKAPRVGIFPQKKLASDESPADFFLPVYALSQRSLTELLQRASSGQSSPIRNEARLELHKRISYIFLGLPLLLTGIPLLLLVHRGRGRDLAIALPASAFIAFIAWGLWSIGQGMAGAGYLPPLPASWAIHLLAGGGGWYLLGKYC